MTKPTVEVTFADQLEEFTQRVERDAKSIKGNWVEAWSNLKTDLLEQYDQAVSGGDLWLQEDVVKLVEQIERTWETIVNRGLGLSWHFDKRLKRKS
jgi:hypothetical protein